MKTRKSSTSPIIWLRLGESGWTLWERDGGSAGQRGARLLRGVGENETLPPLPSSGASITIPASSYALLTLWLETEDKTLFPDLIRTQLEQRLAGCELTGSHGWGWHLLRQHEGRSLVQAWVLRQPLPSSLEVGDLVEFAPGWDCVRRLEEGMTAWHEGDLLVVAICLEGTLLSLFTSRPVHGDSGWINQLLATLLRLQGEGLLPEKQVDDTTEQSRPALCLIGQRWSEQELSLLAAVCNLTHQPNEALAVALPAQGQEAHVPVEVTRQRNARLRRRGVRRLLIACAAVYLLLLLALVVHWAYLGWQVQRTRDLLTANAATVQRLEQTAERWRALFPAIDPSYYPMEALLKCVEHLPEEVRLTQFEHQPKRILIKGEGREAALTFRYLGAIQNDPFLRQWSWAMPQPQILPNNRAQYQIEGTRTDAQPHPK